MMNTFKTIKKATKVTASGSSGILKVEENFLIGSKLLSESEATKKSIKQLWKDWKTYNWILKTPGRPPRGFLLHEANTSLSLFGLSDRITLRCSGTPHRSSSRPYDALLTYRQIVPVLTIGLLQKRYILAKIMQTIQASKIS